MKANESRWTKLRVLQGVLAILFLSFPLLNTLNAKVSGEGTSWLTVMYMTGWGLVGVQLARWGCPQCGHPFLRKVEGGWTNPLRRCCANCGIRAGAEVSL